LKIGRFNYFKRSEYLRDAKKCLLPELFDFSFGVKEDHSCQQSVMKLLSCATFLLISDTQFSYAKALGDN